MLPEDPAVVAAKKALRKHGKALRAEALETHGQAAMERIGDHLFGLIGERPGIMVSGFLAIGSELDPEPLLVRLDKAGYGVALPVMIGKGEPLVFRRWRPGEPLAETTWGIREPLPEAEAVDPDVVLAPLLVFDLEGYRLGYGGGFYDRTLAGLRARKPVVVAGIGFDEQRVDAVPHLDYDERLDWVLTPTGAHRCTD